MKQFLKISTLPILALALSATLATAEDPMSLSVTCGDQNANASEPARGNCNEGMVTFRGAGFPDTVGIQVMSYPVGTLIDSAAYSAAEGNLSFTQTLVPAGTYMVVVSENVEGGAALSTQMITVDAVH